MYNISNGRTSIFNHTKTNKGRLSKIKIKTNAIPELFLRPICILICNTLEPKVWAIHS